MNDDEVIVFCGTLDTAVIAGSKIYKCDKCGEDCSSSPIGQEQINKGGKPYCMQCALKFLKEQMDKGETPKFLDPTPAWNQFIEYLRSRKSN